MHLVPMIQQSFHEIHPEIVNIPGSIENYSHSHNANFEYMLARMAPLQFESNKSFLRRRSLISKLDFPFVERAAFRTGRLKSFKLVFPFSSLPSFLVEERLQDVLLFLFFEFQKDDKQSICLHHLFQFFPREKYRVAFLLRAFAHCS